MSDSTNSTKPSLGRAWIIRLAALVVVISFAWIAIAALAHAIGSRWIVPPLIGLGGVNLWLGLYRIRYVAWRESDTWRSHRLAIAVLAGPQWGPRGPEILNALMQTVFGVALLFVAWAVLAS